MMLSNAAKAGTAIFVGSVQFGIAMILAEVYYLNYNVSLNFISDLGAYCREGSCTVYQPSATIFNTSIVIFGILVLLTSYYLHRAFRSRIISVIVLIAGIGLIGVGAFPETAGRVHSIFSLVTFLFAGLSAIVTYKIQKLPMSYFSVLLGIISLVALALFFFHIYLGLGVGGMERMIVYPVLLWSIGIGSHLISQQA